MTITDFLENWEQCDAGRRDRFLVARAGTLSTQHFTAMKERVTARIWVDADEALALAESMMAAAAQTGTLRHRGLALMALANVYAFGLGRYREAADTYREATAVCRDAGDETLATQAPVGQIYALGMLGQYDEALALGQQLREQAREHGDWATYAKAINNLAIACARRSDYARARELFDEQEEVLNHHLADHDDYLERLFKLHLNRSNMLRALNRYEEALENAQTALAVAERQENDVRVARARDSLGLTYYFLGRYNDSLAAFRRARPVFRSANLTRDAVVAQLFEAQCLLALNDLDAVTETCRDVIAYSSDAGHTHEEAIARTYRATAQRRLGVLSAAEIDLQRAAAVFEEHQNDAWAGQVYLEMAYVRLEMDRLHEASVAASAAQICFERRDLHIDRAQAVLAQAMVLERQGKQNAARRAYRDVLTVGEEETLGWLIYPACHGLARLARVRSHFGRARTRLDQALDAIERLRAGMAVDLRISFLADKLNVYNEAVALALETKELDAALRYVERARARALLEMFQDETSVRLQALDSDDQEIVDEINRLREQRRWLEQRAYHSTPIADRDTATQQDRETWRDEARAVEARIEALFRDLQVRNAAYTATRTLTTLPDAPVQEYLPERTVLLEYFVLDEDLWALVVGSDAIDVARLAPVATIDELLTRWRLHLTHAAMLGARGGVRETHVRAAQTLLARFHAAIFAPLAGSCADARRLYVVPHGALHYIPFAALYDETRGAHLIEEVAMARLPSAGVLAALVDRRQPTDTQGAPLVLGHSRNGALPHAVDEATAISAAVGGECYVEAEAERSRLLDVPAPRSLIHVAAHGLFRADAPLFSAVYLDDGAVTTLDIFNTRLQTALLVLSACESGLGVVHPGDEVMGLSRACLHAGAQSLLMSLWHINDLSTRDVMIDCYRRIVAGAAPADALCAAQRGCITSDTLRHPYYWAAFTIAGDAFTPLSPASTDQD